MGTDLLSSRNVTHSRSTSTTDRSLRSILIGNNSGTSPSTTVASRTPDDSAIPSGIAAIPMTFACPPTPCALAFLSVHAIFSPQSARFSFSLSNARLPINPSCAAVSTTARFGLVVRPTKYDAPPSEHPFQQCSPQAQNAHDIADIVPLKALPQCDD